MLINKFFQFFGSKRQQSNRFELPLLGVILALGLGLTTSETKPTFASGLEASTASNHLEVARSNISQPQTTAAIKTNPLKNGVHLYGQSSQPEQVGKEYLVFETNGGKVTGAFYMPSSEFSCFYGTVNAGQMNLTVVDPYENSTYSHAIALQQNSLVASADQQVSLEDGSDANHPQVIGLQGYYPVETISDNDQRLLDSCRNNSAK